MMSETRETDTPERIQEARRFLSGGFADLLEAYTGVAIIDKQTLHEMRRVFYSGCLVTVNALRTQNMSKDTLHLVTCEVITDIMDEDAR